MAQLELPITREKIPDRNADKGGRSFYFFDFDDNVAFLSTPIYLFHRKTGAERSISSAEYAQAHAAIGRSGVYTDYRLDLCDETGSFRRFRDRDLGRPETLGRGYQPFVEDLASALGFPDLRWQGPSWSCFLHASLNQRPTALITARGHDPDTIRDGISLLVESGHLPHTPNYLGIYPVTNRSVRTALGDEALRMSVAELKKLAIGAAVERAIEVYGANPHHRFGMSDDDPRNIQLIAEAMGELKKKYVEMSFFVIETQEGKFVKWEVYSDHMEATLCADQGHLDAFEQLAFWGD